MDCIRPTAADTVCDPACGTGGFLLAAHDYVVHHQGKDLDPDQKKHLKRGFVKGWELVPNTARLCIMNLTLHGIDADPCPIVSGKDSLASPPGDGDRVSLVLTNPPFGKKSTIAIVNEEGDLEKEDESYERPDFWTSTKNKQLNFLQHVKTLLKINGRCAIVVPDNVLFEGGAGETVRRKLLEQADVHTLLRLPTGIFYAQGVKANVLFFDAKPAREKPWTEKLWVYDFRTNMHHTLKTKPLKRSDLDEFVECYHPANRHHRNATWSETNPGGPLALFHIRGACEAGQAQPRHLLAQGHEPGGRRQPARARRPGAGDRRRLAGGDGAVRGDRERTERLTDTVVVLSRFLTLRPAGHLIQYHRGGLVGAHLSGQASLVSRPYACSAGFGPPFIGTSHVAAERCPRG